MNHPSRRRERAKPRWTGKRIATVAILSYAVYFWVFPVLLLPFFGVLPYLHSYSLSTRFIVSLLPGALIMGSSVYAYRSSRTQLKSRPIPIVLGLIMFTFVAAAWGGNSVAPLVVLLLGYAYEQTQHVADATSRGTKFRRSTHLTLRDSIDGSLHYLVVSRRLFGDVSVNAGDAVVTRGKANVFGTYIRSIVSKPHRVSANNSFKPKPLRGSA